MNSSVCCMLHITGCLDWLLKSVALLAVGSASSISAYPDHPSATLDEDVASFSNLSDTVSVGGNSYCLSGTIQVTVTSQNFHINLEEPEDQLAAIEFVVELLQANSDLMKRVVGEAASLSGTYAIFSNLCLPGRPDDANIPETVQFLTHGDTVSSRYWDIAPGYSYIDAITAAGYAAFSYDRIGVGQSEHPDPIQVVQGPLQVEIAHALVTMLRNGQIGGHEFEKLIGVAHSAGAAVTQGQTTKYPKDFDAVILTGSSTLTTYVPLSLAAFDFQIANQADARFKELSNGYLTQSNAMGIQFVFFRYPNFDPNVFQITVNDKEPNALGEFLTLGTVVAPSPAFTGPVDVVLGQNDMIFCGGDCMFPTDQSAAVQPAFYPNAAPGSTHFIVPGAGHIINAHYGAKASWEHQLEFLRTNGL